MSNYLGTKELEQVRLVLDRLNIEGFKDVSFGTFKVYDVNGDILGYVGMTENGEYGFFFENPDKE